jgi:hypothetical protein
MRFTLLQNVTLKQMVQVESLCLKVRLAETSGQNAGRALRFRMFCNKSFFLNVCVLSQSEGTRKI